MLSCIHVHATCNGACWEALDSQADLIACHAFELKFSAFIVCRGWSISFSVQTFSLV